MPKAACINTKSVFSVSLFRLPFCVCVPVCFQCSFSLFHILERNACTHTQTCHRCMRIGFYQLKISIAIQHIHFIVMLYVYNMYSLRLVWIRLGSQMLKIGDVVSLVGRTTCYPSVNKRLIRMGNNRLCCV